MVLKTLDQQITKQLTKFPFLGDIASLGALFGGTSFTNRESELMISITPRIVRIIKPGERPQLPSIEKYDYPDIRQVPVPGREERRPWGTGHRFHECPKESIYYLIRERAE